MLSEEGAVDVRRPKGKATILLLDRVEGGRAVAGRLLEQAPAISLVPNRRGGADRPTVPSSSGPSPDPPSRPPCPSPESRSLSDVLGCLLVLQGTRRPLQGPAATAAVAKVPPRRSDTRIPPPPARPLPRAPLAACTRPRPAFDGLARGRARARSRTRPRGDQETSRRPVADKRRLPRRRRRGHHRRRRLPARPELAGGKLVRRQPHGRFSNGRRHPVRLGSCRPACARRSVRVPLRASVAGRAARREPTTPLVALGSRYRQQQQQRPRRAWQPIHPGSAPTSSRPDAPACRPEARHPRN